LLEELGLPYELVRVQFQPPAQNFFAQQTPMRKRPTIEDGAVVMAESGAIVEYILERYGNGRLAPAVGSPDRPAFLQWLHFAESTAFPPLGILVWLTLYRGDAAEHTTLIADARRRAAQGLVFLEQALGNRAYLLGDEFSAADIMMGFTLVAARMFGLLDANFPKLLGKLCTSYAIAPPREALRRDPQPAYATPGVRCACRVPDRNTTPAVSS
jgi:glutathione S-transferase